MVTWSWRMCCKFWGKHYAILTNDNDIMHESMVTPLPFVRSLMFCWVYYRLQLLFMFGCGGKIAYGCGGKMHGDMVVADVLCNPHKR